MIEADGKEIVPENLKVKIDQVTVGETAVNGGALGANIL